MIKTPILFISLISFFITFVNSAQWLVNVGAAGGKNVFAPDNFDANIGDNVIFNFIDGIHDVIQSDESGKCDPSKSQGAFTIAKTTGDAAAPPQETLPLTKAGPFFYFCNIADHCTVGKMVGKINVLETGAKIAVPGVPAEQASPIKGPPAQPPAPADDEPNIPVSAPSSPSASSTSSSPSPSVSVPPTLSGGSLVNPNKQISIAVVGGALLSLVGFIML